MTVLLLVVRSQHCQAEPAGEDAAGKAQESEIIYDLEGKIQEHINNLVREKEIIEEFLQINAKENTSEQVGVEEYVSHPVNSYLLLKRMTYTWKLFKNKLEAVDIKDLGKEIQLKLKLELENTDKEVCLDSS